MTRTAATSLGSAAGIALGGVAGPLGAAAGAAAGAGIAGAMADVFTGSEKRAEDYQEVGRRGLGEGHGVGIRV